MPSKNSAITATNRLCDVCSSFGLNINQFLYRPRGHKMMMGNFQDIIKRRTCPLCCVVTNLLKSENPEIFDQKFSKDPITEKETTDPITVRIFWAQSDSVYVKSIKTDHKRVMLGIDCSSVLLTHTYLVPYSNHLIAGGALSDQLSARHAGGIKNKALLASSWMKMCENLHGPQCTRKWLDRTPPASVFSELTFIDVHNNCLVEKSPKRRYVALSYVWGVGEAETINMYDRVFLRQKGALETKDLAKTVRDAMKFTKYIGERYLWVGSICIPRHTSEDERRHLARLDSIYSGALVTLISVDTEDPKLGLFYDQPNDYNRRVSINSDLELIAVKTYNAQRSRDNFVHFKNAWGYVAELMSRRRILFADGLIFFSCREASWREDLILEGTQSSCHNFLSFDMVFEELTHKMGPLDAYSACVVDYSCREVDSETNFMRPFVGISRALCECMDTTLHFGLPFALWDWAMLWYPEKSGKPRPDLPSWSWLSWTGGAGTAPVCDGGCILLLSSHTWIQWYYGEDKREEWVPLAKKHGARQHLTIPPRVAPPPKVAHKSSQYLTQGSTPRTIYRQYIRDTLDERGGNINHSPLYRIPQLPSVLDLAPSETGPAPRRGRLRFWTVSATFNIERIQDCTGASTVVMDGWVVKDNESKGVGFLYSGYKMHPEETGDLTGRAELILLTERYKKFRFRLPGEEVPDGDDIVSIDGQDLRQELVSQVRGKRELSPSLPIDIYTLLSFERPQNGQDSKGVKNEDEVISGTENGEVERDGDATMEDEAELNMMSDPDNWTLYNVLAIEWNEGIARRMACGWIQREAVSKGVDGPVWKEITLK